MNFSRARVVFLKTFQHFQQILQNFFDPKTYKNQNFPGIEEFLHTFQRNIEAISSANRSLLEAVQNMAHRHMELIHETVTSVPEHLRQLSAEPNVQKKASKQAALLRQNCEKACDNLRNTASDINRVSTNALTLLNNRFLESMDEMKASFDRGGPSN